MSLGQRNLAAIASLGVRVPAYDRAALVPRILHVGVYLRMRSPGMSRSPRP